MLRRCLPLVLVASLLGAGSSAKASILDVQLLPWDGLRIFHAFTWGDANADGVVGAADLEHWRSGFGGASLIHSGTKISADANYDRQIDGTDFLTWQLNLGRPTYTLSSTPNFPYVPPLPSAARAVPEPASLVLLLLAGAPWAIARRRRRPRGEAEARGLRSRGCNV